MAIDVSWFRSRPRKIEKAPLRPECPSKAPIRKHTDAVYEFADTLVGEGAFSTVRQLRRRGDGQLFALKVFKSSLTSPLRIQGEFYVARGMRHRNIIETYDLLEFHGSQGLLMEYAPRCLFDIVSRGALRPGDTQVYLRQLLAGTAHIHQLGFAHRDLKLENVVIGTNGQAKIVDFGSVSTTKPSRPSESMKY
jgi:serine/threonine protein kinase